MKPNIKDDGTNLEKVCALALTFVFGVCVCILKQMNSASVWLSGRVCVQHV